MPITLTSSNDTAWNEWVVMSSGTATCGASSVVIWGSWCNDGTTVTSTTTNSTVWTTWCSGTTTSSTPLRAWQEETAEVRAARERMHAEATARLQEEQRKRKEAEERAEKLLVENLSLRQRLEYEKDKSFIVHGTRDRRYRIRPGRQGNVDVIGRDGRIQHRLCAHPSVDVPNADTMLAQKLHLELDDDAFVRVANRHAAYDNARPVLPALH
jgi:hypothetical protein